ncbi:hypothetical protein ES705_17486 [subsurface metagenome]
MDEASRRLRGGYSQWFTRISPEEEFMAHCSNIQAFFENELNTDILHSDIAFPLLRKLVSLRYKPAKRVFNKEIVKRYNEGTWKTRMFLKSEGYLKYLNREEKRVLEKDKHLETYTYDRIPKPRDRKIESILDETPKIIVGFKVEPIRIFEYNDKASEFKEVQKKYPLSTLLDSDKIVVFDDPRQGKMWIWHGFNTTTRMRYYAKQLAPHVREQYGIGFKAIYVDEGFEPLEFKIMIKTKEEPTYKGTESDLELLKSLSREKILLLLEKFKEVGASSKVVEIDGKKFDIREIRRNFLGSEIRERRISPKEDFDLFFKLIKEGIAKIEFLMKEQSMDELTIHRQYLLEIFNEELLLISYDDGYPTFKPGVLECFVFKGILSMAHGNVIKFFKINQEKIKNDTGKSGKEMLEEKREPIINLLVKRIISKMKFIEKFKKYEMKKKWRKRYRISEEEYNKRKDEVIKLTEYKTQILNGKDIPELLNIWKGKLKVDTILIESRYYELFKRNITYYTQRMQEEPESTSYQKFIEISTKCMKKLIEGTDAFTVLMEYQKGLMNG